MPAGPRSPFDGTTHLIVDGTNLLYRLGGGGKASPPAAVIGRLRAAVPRTIAIDLVFDGAGHGVFGRLAEGMYVRWAGRRSADDVILDLASEAAMEAGGPAGAGTVLVVTNDRDLAHRVAMKGARTAALQWLIHRMDLPVLASPAAGNRRPPTIGAGSPGAGPHPDGRDDEGRRPWKPGRGATAKTGQPRKVARHKRHPRPC
jgi:rRNA-processing protein FCF1